MKTISVVIFLTLIATYLSGCTTLSSQAQRNRALAIMATIESDLPWFGTGASNVAAFRMAVEEMDEVKELILLGLPAAELAKDRFTQPNLPNADHALSIYAYLIEWHKLTDAKKILEDYLRSSPGSKDHWWAPYFAVRALFVLKGLPDASGGYREYTDEEIVKAITSP